MSAIVGAAIDAAIDAVMDAVDDELSRTICKHGSFHSSHEGYGVLSEEMAELLDAIRANDPAQVRAEAIQVAAMAARMVLDLG